VIYNEMDCTHIALYVKNVEVTHRFYTECLGCALRRFSSDEGFLSIAVGRFIINFYQISDKELLIKNDARGIAHLGFEVETRAIVDSYAEQFQLSHSFCDKRKTTYGPYRFYVNDPDGYTVEIHTWDGVKEG
jgi:catechol 2,3-dioxygenase-like lactoylglutathione lyase family enzyme